MTFVDGPGHYTQTHPPRDGLDRLDATWLILIRPDRLKVPHDDVICADSIRIDLNQQVKERKSSSEAF